MRAIVKGEWLQSVACHSNLMEDEQDFCLSLWPNDTAMKWAIVHFHIHFTQNTGSEHSGQSLLIFSPLRSWKYMVWIRASCTEPIGLELVHLLRGFCWNKQRLFCYSLFSCLLREKHMLGMWQWGPLKQEESFVVSHMLYFCMAKGEMAQLCDQREFVLKTGVLWICQSAERRFFTPVIPLPVTGAGSRSALIRLQSPHSVQRCCALNSGDWGCWCLLNFFSLLDLQKWKVSLKKSPQEATEGRYWQETPFFPFLAKNCCVLNLTWGMLKKPYQMNRRGSS